MLEFLEGQSLEEYVNAHGALSIDTALEIIVQACAGLQAAHGRPEGGIIHRDLKPENLFITPRSGNQRFVKVLDFGIAKLNDEILAGGLKTGSHMVMGTPGYMSHEQAKGSANVDHRTDIYAMGVIAYRILTGRMPYAATSIGSLVAAQLTQGPPNPSELRADLPPGWVHTIQSALSNEPHERPQSVREFAMRLVEATPNGRQIAMQVASAFMQSAPAPSATVRLRGPAAGQPPAMPSGGGTVALKQPTTLSSAASEVPSEALAGEPATRASRWPIALGLVTVLAAGGVGLGFAMKGGDESSGEPQIAAAAPSSESTPAAPPAPTLVDVPVVTSPPGAYVRIGNLRYGPTPTSIRLRAGEDVTLLVELEGHEPLEERLSVVERAEPLELALTPVKVEEPDSEPPVAAREERRKKPRTRRTKPKDSAPTTAPKTTPEVEKPKPPKKKPKGFDPDAPAG